MSRNRPPFRDGVVNARAHRSAYDADARKDESPADMPDTPDCPFCDGVETELMSSFGAHASVSTYWCRTCRSPFEIVKWRGRG